MLAIAWFVKGVEENSAFALLGSAFAAALAALDAYQAVFIVPILGFYLWQKKDRSVFAWSVIFAAPAAIGAWQIYGRRQRRRDAGGDVMGLHAKVRLASRRRKRLKNTAALVVHSAWIVSPLLIRGNRWNWVLGAIAAAGGAFYDPNPMFWALARIGRRGFVVVLWAAIFWTPG